MIQPEFEAHIMAAGESSRMRPALDALGHPADYPKHLLPTGNPGGETLTGRIIRQALVAPGIGSLTVHASEANERHFRQQLVGEPVVIRTGSAGGNFGPLAEAYGHRRHAIIATSGDFYTDTPWSSIIGFHRSHDFPVTYLVGHSLPVPNAAIFSREGVKAVAWKRQTELSSSHDLINVGLYVFDQHPGVQAVFEETGSTEGEVISSALIDEGLLALYAAEKTVYNVNTPATYQALLNATSEVLQAEVTVA